MPSQTSSLRAYGLRARSGSTACSVAAVLAACAVSPSLAVADDTGSYDAVLSAKSDVQEKPGKRVGQIRRGEVVPVPTVAPEPLPTVAAPAPAPVTEPAPTPARLPTPTATLEAPKSEPAPREAAPEAPRATPQAPAATSDRSRSHGRTPARTPDDVGAAPSRGGSAPAVKRFARKRSARRRDQASRPTGGPVDSFDRPGAARNGESGRSGASTGSTPEGRTSSRSESGSGSGAVEATGVTATLSHPLQAVDEVTGGSLSPLLVVGALAAMAVALGFGVRRKLHRWSARTPASSTKGHDLARVTDQTHPIGAVNPRFAPTTPRPNPEESDIAA